MPHSLSSSASFAVAAAGQAAEIRANNQPAQLDIRPAGEHSIRVTLKPISFKPDFPFTPALAEREYAAPAISLREISQAGQGPSRQPECRSSAQPADDRRDDRRRQADPDTSSFRTTATCRSRSAASRCWEWAKADRCRGETFARFPSSLTAAVDSRTCGRVGNPTPMAREIQSP